ncbi:MAG: hypothetical protein ABI183_03145 [Polyangiaceae bacterium]
MDVTAQAEPLSMTAPSSLPSRMDPPSVTLPPSWLEPLSPVAPS